MAGKTVGPLAGVPVGIKDLVYTKGIRTTSGSIIYKDYVPTEDDVVVERLKAAGAIIIGKTNVPELGYSGASYNLIFPPTNNPWNTERTAGGSSAGSGAAVAAGIGPMAIGSDGGGSVRIPASINGLFGLKGSMGRVPLYPGTKDETAPGVSGWELIEHIGPITRTVADGALMMSVIASGPDDRDRRTIPNDVNWMEAIKGDIKGLRVAWTPDWGYAQVDPEVREVCAKAAKVFADQLGCKLEEASPWKDDYFGHFFTIVLTETDLKGMRELVAKYGDHMQPHLVDAIKGTMTDTQITDAVVARKKCANQAWRFFRSYDLLLTPTIACPRSNRAYQGPEMIEGKKADPFQWITFTYQFNMTGQPAATVPAGFTKDGLPDRPADRRGAPRRRNRAAGGGRLRGCCALERQVAANASADKSMISYQTARCLSSRSSHGRSPFKGRILTTGPVSEGMRAAKNEWVYLRPAAADGLEQKRRLAEFFDWYNLRRPHQSLRR